MCDLEANSGVSVEGAGDGSRVCWHILPFALAYLDGRLGGLMHLCVKAHIARCRSCQKALAALRTIGERLQNLRHTPPDGAGESLETERWTALESAWSDAEKKRTL